MNLCVFVGNFVRDPELKKVGGNQTAVTNFTLAVDRPFLTKSGEERNQTQFLDFEVWDTAAERIEKECVKGNKIMVIGSARKNSWEDAEGKKRSRVVFRVDRFELLKSIQKEDEPATVNTNEEIPF